jgi:hypothetical protein
MEFVYLALFSAAVIFGLIVWANNGRSHQGSGKH